MTSPFTGHACVLFEEEESVEGERALRVISTAHIGNVSHSNKLR